MPAGPVRDAELLFVTPDNCLAEMRSRLLAADMIWSVAVVSVLIAIGFYPVVVTIETQLLRRR